MENFNENSQKAVYHTEEKIKVLAKPGCNRVTEGKRTRLVKREDKVYTVRVTYIGLPEKEAKMKRAILESIMKQGHIPNHCP